MENKKLLGSRIKEIRKSNKLTQEQLAELIGIETGSLSSIESGRHFPSLLTLEKIAAVLNVKLKAFFDFETVATVEEIREKVIENIVRIDKKELACLYKLTEFLSTV